MNHRFLAVALLCGVALVGCPSPETLSDAQLTQLFEQASAHAAKLGPEHIYRDLTAVNAYNSALEWEGSPGASRVKMVTWTSYDGYVVGKSMRARWEHKYQPNRDLWVTAAPQLREFVKTRGIKPAALELRLKQLLGMPHDTERLYVVEFWVHPADLFRPSPDPEITDHAAELDFPPDTLFMSISDKHKQWIQWQRENNTWPWTGLGYTYDWGNPISIVGLSEFVIRSGAEIAVASVTPTLDYFGM